MALLLAASPAETGCGDECSGTSCGPPGVYVLWTPDQVPEADTFTVCVDGVCTLETPDDGLLVRDGQELRAGLHLVASVAEPSERSVDVRLELRRGVEDVAIYEGIGTLEHNCCGYGTEMGIVDGALADKT